MNTTPTRVRILNKLADLILQTDRPHPLRVAIDGCDAAGKTTLANELAPIDAVQRRYQDRYIPGKSGANVTPEKYKLIREAMLEILPREGNGLTLNEMVSLIQPRVPIKLFPNGVTWYTVTVKLDLEAKGLVKRLPETRPLRHLKVQRRE